MSRSHLWLRVDGQIMPLDRWENSISEGELASLAVIERSSFQGLSIYAGLVALVSAVAYMALAQVDRVSIARGVLRPEGDVLKIQAPVAGRIERLHVKAGEVVKAADALVRLTNPEFDADLEKHRQSLHRAAERALGLIARASVLLNAELAAAQVECAEIDRGRKGLEALYEKGILATDEVLQKSASSRACWARAKAVRLRQEQIEIARAQTQSILSGHTRPGAGTGPYDPDVAAALAEVSRLAEELKLAESQQESLVIRAPKNGTITHLAVRGVGEVVALGQEIGYLAPQGSALVFEACMSNEEAGAVRPGQTATIVLDAYPPGQFGTLPARVIRVLPDATFNENRYCFPVHAVLFQDRVGRGLEQYPLRIGLSGRVEVQTSRESILSIALIAGKNALYR